jgi:hypothetical protein
MTVAMAGLPNAMWTGLSGDTMPTDARVHENDIFFQTDTGLYFLWTGAAWVTYPIGGGGVDLAAGANSVSSGTAVFSNANGVSWGIVGQTITASVGTFAAAPVNFSAGTTSNNLGTIVFSNSNNVSAGLSGSTVTWSVANQTNQTLGLYASSQTTGQSSSSTVDARSLTFVGMGNISVGLSGGSYLISQTGGAGGAALSAAGSSQNAGTIVFSNSNNVSFGMNGSTITASASAQSNQTLGLYASSNTTGQSSSSTVDARSLTFVGLATSVWV